MLANCYSDYVWKNGIPQGISKVSDKKAPTYYKIAMDPYRKRISIEQYEKGAFKALVYDSALLNFRNLSPREQMAWQKTTASEQEDLVVSLIRDQDDRLVCIEKCLFENGYCKKCELISPHGFLLSVHIMHYQTLGDDFNGVILYDAHQHPVMIKRYDIDAQSGEFTKLLDEKWDLTSLSFLGS